MTTFAPSNSTFKTPSAYRLTSGDDSDDDSILGDVPVLSSVANELLAENSGLDRRSSVGSKTPGSNSKTSSSRGVSSSAGSPDFHTARNFVTPAARTARRAYLSSVTRISDGSSGSGEGSAEKNYDLSRIGDGLNAPSTIARTIGSIARARPTTISKRPVRALGIGMPIRGPRRDYTNQGIEELTSPEEFDESKQDFLAESHIQKEQEATGMRSGGDRGIDSSIRKISMSGETVRRESIEFTRDQGSPNQYNPLKRQSSASWREQAVPSKRESPDKKRESPLHRDYAPESPVEMMRKAQLQNYQAGKLEFDFGEGKLVSRSNSRTSSASRPGSQERSALKFSLPYTVLDKENDKSQPKKLGLSSFEISKPAFEKSRPSPPPSPILERKPAPKPQEPQPTSPRRALGSLSVNTPRRAAPPPPQAKAAPPAPSKDTATTSTRRKRQHVIVNGKQYLRLDQIGRGGSAKVYKVMAENYKMLAMKKVVLEKQDEATIRGFKGEIDLLRKLQDVDRVVRLYDYEINDERSTLTVLLECGESDLNRIITSRHHSDDSTLDVSFVRHYWKEMLECVEAVHARNIVHSDLKPANFLLVQGRLKLIDFGIANAIQDDTVNVHREHQVGTVSYMAPETIVDFNSGKTTSDGRAAPRLHKLGAPSDVWSLGCILYQMTYGRTPFAHLSTLYHKMSAIPDPRHEIDYPSTGIGGTPVPASLIATMKGCLDRDKDKRLTIREMLSYEDPFLNPDRVREGAADISEDVLVSLMENVAEYTKEKGAPTEQQIRVWAKDVFGKLKKKMLERRGSTAR
ncbi:Dual-specificity kinase, spindle pole body (SPB) duplication and spindle checkpoint function [Orbilia blumenaviensis]|uniref:Dual-specificity kinase, spindle pole body (SPB) duplication and spindle checkpoint function n=1 Tax=Orbilia blumenaviensis TaxID=1796055 RepID=A0AAV9U8J8_9PEZI